MRYLSIFWMSLMSIIFITACTNQVEDKREERYAISAYQDVANDDTITWSMEQLMLTKDYMSHIPFYGAIVERMRSLQQYAHTSVMNYNWERCFFERNDGTKAKDILYKMNSLNARPTVFFDPNELYDGRMMSLLRYRFSADGSYIALVVRLDNEELRGEENVLFFDVETGIEYVNDRLTGLIDVYPCWGTDGLFYGEYEEEGEMAYGQPLESQHVKFHKFGTTQKDDVMALTAYNKLPGKCDIRTYGTDLSRVFILHIPHEYNKCTLSLINWNIQRAAIVCSDPDAFCFPVARYWDTIYLWSNTINKNGGLYGATVEAPKVKDWWPIVKPSDRKLQDVGAAYNNFVLTYYKNGTTQTEIFNLSGEHVKNVEMPRYGSSKFHSSLESRNIFYTVSSFALPTTVYKYDMQTGTSVAFSRSGVNFNPELYETELVLLDSPTSSSKQIPLYLTYKKDIEFDGTTPCILRLCEDNEMQDLINFDMHNIIMLENNCIYAQALINDSEEIDAITNYLKDNQYTSMKYVGMIGRGKIADDIAKSILHSKDKPAVTVMLTPTDDIINYAPDQTKLTEEFPSTLVVSKSHGIWRYVNALQQNTLLGKNPKLLYRDKPRKQEGLTNEEYATMFNFFWYNIGRTKFDGQKKDNPQE